MRIGRRTLENKGRRQPLFVMVSCCFRLNRTWPCWPSPSLRCGGRRRCRHRPARRRPPVGKWTPSASGRCCRRRRTRSRSVTISLCLHEVAVDGDGAEKILVMGAGIALLADDRDHAVIVLPSPLLSCDTIDLSSPVCAEISILSPWARLKSRITSLPKPSTQ